jgi:hypothetical protein
MPRKTVGIYAQRPRSFPTKRVLLIAIAIGVVSAATWMIVM